MAGKMKDYVGLADQFADDVLSGRLPSCRLIRLACLRWESDKERDDIRMDARAAAKVCAYAETCHHYKGPLAGKALHLEPWQVFILVNIFGWKRASDGLRRFRYADVLVPRKNGKTILASVVANYMLFLDGEGGPEVYAVAVDQEQAKLCWQGSLELLRGSMVESLAKVTESRNLIECPGNAGFYKPLSKETKNKDGTNPHCAICDELHAWPTEEMKELIVTGMGARLQPLLFCISTAGLDTTLPYFAHIAMLKEVLEGAKSKDNHFIMLYQPDDGDAWDDEATWAKVNPNLGVSLGLDYMRQRCEEAKLKGGSTLAHFCVKNLNLWVDAPEVWIPDDDVVANSRAFDESLLEGEECWVGIDLARKTDITATAFWFPKYNVAKFLFTVPETKITELEDRVDYRLWQADGWITAVPGSVMDEDWYMTYLLGHLAKYDIKAICYDPWGAWNLLAKFGPYQDRLMEYQQSIRYMSVPTKYLESMMLRHEVNLLGNPVIRWMFRNVVVYTDPNANIKLDKARSRNKIDGVVALVDAIGGWLNQTAHPAETKEIYTDHSLRVLSL